MCLEGRGEPGPLPARVPLEPQPASFSAQDEAGALPYEGALATPESDAGEGQQLSLEVPPRPEGEMRAALTLRAGMPLQSAIRSNFGRNGEHALVEPCVCRKWQVWAWWLRQSSCPTSVSRGCGQV